MTEVSLTVDERPAVFDKVNETVFPEMAIDVTVGITLMNL